MIARRSVPILALALAACASGETDPTALRSDLDVEATLFLAQTRPADAVMDALFVGVIERDAQGCLRLAGEGDRPTAVWPYRFTLAAQGAGVVVRDPGGREVGRIGGSFRLGGGEVSALHEGIPLPAGQRERAAERCPGRFWIVGDVP